MAELSEDVGGIRRTVSGRGSVSCVFDRASMGQLKRWWLGTFHGSMSLKHMPFYFEEFTFRFNRRRRII